MTTAKIIENLRQAQEKSEQATNMRIESRQMLYEAMKKARGELGLSAEKFGIMCGVTPQYVFRIESGKAHWSEKSISQFINALEEKL